MSNDHNNVLEKRPATPATDWRMELAIVIAKARFGPGLDMGGRHNPKPSEIRAAKDFLDAYDEQAAARAGTLETALATIQRLSMAGLRHPPVILRDINAIAQAALGAAPSEGV